MNLLQSLLIVGLVSYSAGASINFVTNTKRDSLVAEQNTMATESLIPVNRSLTYSFLDAKVWSPDKRAVWYIPQALRCPYDFNQKPYLFEYYSIDLLKEIILHGWPDKPPTPGYWTCKRHSVVMRQ